ncbi:hypothetical protein MOO46_05360 [Apilactobacillus apisilvae]|uniref:WxL domain-containing protein n=1 Tax=Apilactobacillus apisilvae TaxID=2923364 RepID=A0ABY4PFU8_9LACO|nr:hypothetical protein [Apilactobacillus apisilvae]UQS84678.1 hypothetical protein MOO46_05360 [Apilactobacillus apisilvae]
MFFDKKTMLTVFAGVALLSASSASGITAFADDYTGKDTSGNGPVNIDESGKNVNNGSFSNGISSTQGTGSNTYGSGTSNSDAHIKVVQGYLVLETVPSLGFQDVSATNTKSHISNSVIDNHNVLNTDTFWNNDREPENLEVLDARTQGGAPSNQQGGGYAVTANLGQFNTYNSSNGDSPDNSMKDQKGAAMSGNLSSNAGSGFTLNLNGQISKSDDNNASVTNDGSLKSDGSSNNGIVSASKNKDNSLLVLSNNTIGSGTTDVNFNKKSTLTVPTNVPGGQYAAPITWTLAPTANGDVDTPNGN